MRLAAPRVMKMAALLLAALTLLPSQGFASNPPAPPAFALAVVGNGTLMVSWAPVLGATKYEVAYSSDGGANWISHANNLTGTRVTVTGVNYTKVYAARVRAGNANGWSGWKNTNQAGPWSTEKVVTTPIDDKSREALRSAQEAARKTQPGLPHGQASPDPAPALYIHFTAIADTTATLNLVNNGAAWSYKQGSGSCSAAQNGSTTSVSLTGLTAETAYTYRAWANTTCSGSPMAMDTFTTTPPPHVTNLHSVSSGGSPISSSAQQGVAFTTGSNSGGYTLGSVTISMKKSGNVTPSNLAITLHSMAGANPYNMHNSYPSTTTLDTLTGTPPISTSFTDTAFTCSGSGCELSASTTYFVVATYTSPNGNYEWRYVGTDTQSGSPSGHGWKIERSHQKHIDGNWNSWGDWHLFRADFTIKSSGSGSSSSVTATGAAPVASATQGAANHTGAQILGYQGVLHAGWTP